MKRILIGLGFVVVMALFALGVLLAVAFGGLKSQNDGQELAGGARLVKDGFVALYVLPAGDKDVALVDCGNDAEASAILAALRQRGLGAEAVQAIFLTHGHADHIGGCHNFSHAQVYAFPQEKDLAEGTGRAHGPLTSLVSTPKNKLTKITRTLADGETVTIGNLSVRAFAIPGHTSGSAAYFANGVLYLGDSAAIESTGSIRAAPWAFSDDSLQNRTSLKRLAERMVAEKLEVRQLAPSHSGVGEGFKALESYMP